MRIIAMMVIVGESARLWQFQCKEVLEERIELSRTCVQRILSPQRLPIPPLKQLADKR